MLQSRRSRCYKRASPRSTQALDAHIAAASRGGGGGGGGDIGSDAAAAVAAAAATAQGARSGGDDALLQQTGEADFRKAAKVYGALGDEMLGDVFRKVTTRLKGSLVQLQAMQEEESGGDGGEEDDDGGVAGFGKAERLSGVGVGRALKGGLVKRHTFQVRYRAILGDTNIDNRQGNGLWSGRGGG